MLVVFELQCIRAVSILEVFFCFVLKTFCFLDWTLGDLMTTLPFENTVDYLELQGIHLLEMLEHAVSQTWSETEFIGPFTLHFTGILKLKLIFWRVKLFLG